METVGPSNFSTLLLHNTNSSRHYTAHAKCIQKTLNDNLKFTNMSLTSDLSMINQALVATKDILFPD